MLLIIRGYQQCGGKMIAFKVTADLVGLVKEVVNSMEDDSMRILFTVKALSEFHSLDFHQYKSHVKIQMLALYKDVEIIG